MERKDIGRHIGQNVSNKRIVINVSGQKYETFECTLDRYPETLLGDKTERSKFYHASQNEYFFDRSHVLFESILFFYQSNGCLRCPANVSTFLFESECQYFRIPEDEITSMKIKEGYIPLTAKNDFCPQSRFEKIRHLIEYPQSSKAARYYCITSCCVTITSVVLMCVQSIIWEKDRQPKYPDAIFIIDMAVTLWFIIDTTFIIIASKTTSFSVFKNPLIYLDLLGSYPYFVFLIIQIPEVQWFAFFRIFRILKILRLLRIFVTPRKEELLLNILYGSLPDLGLLVLCLSIVVIFGASTAFMAESVIVDTPFISIPECSWWSLQTVIMIGYGDIVPETIAGKLVAIVVMVLGATTIALPVLAVAAQFIDKYKRNAEVVD